MPDESFSVRFLLSFAGLLKTYSIRKERTKKEKEDALSLGIIYWNGTWGLNLAAILSSFLLLGSFVVESFLPFCNIMEYLD